MWRGKLSLLLSITVFVIDKGFQTSFRPHYCTLQCVCQGSPGCEYCRISKDDVETTLGFTSAGLFAGLQSPEVCQHYVHAPRNVTIEFVESQNPKYETVVVSWRPSQYGIAFLRGFLVSLQTLGGTQSTCQLLLLQNNMSFSAVHAQRVYYSDFFTDLSLGTQYAVTVMALPVPEIWEKFYHRKLFFTRSCPEKNGLEHCKTDWYPRYIEVHQENKDIVVTFNLAPKKLGISRYFSSCFGRDSRSIITVIQPDFSVNSTHHTYRLQNLHTETNYTCEIAADIVDAVRKPFFVQVQHTVKDPSALNKASVSLAVLFSVGILLAVFLSVIFTIHWQKKQKQKAAKTETPSDITEEYYDEYTEHQFLPLENRTRPPRLLICYSSSDGSAHIRVVLQLATFLQKHMATEVHLDLWDALRMTEEGDFGWYCRKMKESDFVLVICSNGLNQRQHNQREVEERTNTSLAIIAMIGEELFRAKSLSQDISKYITATFEYSKSSDIPTMLSLASHYTLPEDLPLLFSHLHGVSLQKPGAYLQIENISENGYSKLPAGAALLLAIEDASIFFSGLYPSGKRIEGPGHNKIAGDNVMQEPKLSCST
ncbi:interleukin-17 receptor D isoform X3 [Tachysurus fulvidraco]|uniref:interleukin-17 receptor D isoform X3 n=1 Tax=Tachysurus fulvidraco TaxID=1234273 RepID=UPI000F4D3FBB|nr:interleukin-17 receptor D isoform X3 [Tachysurus fulvidraco]